MQKILVFLCLLILSWSYSTSALAQAQPLEQFLQTAFPGNAGSKSEEPTAKTLWLTTQLKQTLEEKFNYHCSQLRLHYWQRAGFSAWVLDEIGKERPITIGVAVSKGKITQLEILAYRESRGGEVEQSFFTDQFTAAGLTQKRGTTILNQHIDGITGATLSVRAVKKVATIALFLDDYVNHPH